MHVRHYCVSMMHHWPHKLYYSSFLWHLATDHHYQGGKNGPKQSLDRLREKAKVPLKCIMLGRV